VKNFFKNGFELNSISDTQANFFMELVKKEIFNSNNIYAEDTDLHPPEISYQPTHLLTECQSWFEQNSLGLQSCLGVFDYFICTINKFNNNQGMMWHNDHIDGTCLTTLIYLSEISWKDEYGGCLELGFIDDAKHLIEPRLSPEKYPLVKKTHRIVPKHGTTVTINNLSLPFCHRVTPMLVDSTRYTLMFHAGYWNNTVNARRHFGVDRSGVGSIKEGS
jgi:Rps23 Pro-64 3,4-dihydroxylase Tpa1-like proline 4-hydroxylase